MSSVVVGGTLAENCSPGLNNISHYISMRNASSLDGFQCNSSVLCVALHSLMHLAHYFFQVFLDGKVLSYKVMIPVYCQDHLE